MQLVLRPMLANRVKWKKVKFPLLVQPKLNGLRAMAMKGQLVSRDSILWDMSTLPHIQEALSKLPEGYILDGELYAHGLSLQKINSRAAVSRKTMHEDAETVKLHVFDIVSSKGANERQQMLDELSTKFDSSLLRVRTYTSHTRDGVEALHSSFLNENYEGTMLRAYNDPYATKLTCGNKELRVDSLLKLKDFLDLDATILETVPGEGKLAGLVGSFLVQHQKAIFTVGSGLSMSEREELTQTDCVGKTVKVKYEMLSDKGVPLKPTIIAIL